MRTLINILSSGEKTVYGAPVKYCPRFSREGLRKHSQWYKYVCWTQRKVLHVFKTFRKPRNDISKQISHVMWVSKFTIFGQILTCVFYIYTPSMKDMRVAFWCRTVSNHYNCIFFNTCSACLVIVYVYNDTTRSYLNRLHKNLGQ